MAITGAEDFAQNVDDTNRVQNRSRQRPGSFLEITRLLAQAVPYLIDSSAAICTFWARPLGSIPSGMTIRN